MKEFLAITEEHTYGLIKNGLLPAFRVGRRIRVSEESLNNWIPNGASLSDRILYSGIEESNVTKGFLVGKYKYQSMWHWKNTNQ